MVFRSRYWATSTIFSLVLVASVSWSQGATHVGSSSAALGIASVQDRTALLERVAHHELGSDVGLGSMPPGLSEPDPARRALALLRAVDLAERGAASDAGLVRDDCARALAWVRAVQQLDDDEGVRALASFFDEIGAVPSEGCFDVAGPAWLLSRRGTSGFSSRTFIDLPLRASDLAWELAALPELSTRELGPSFARVLIALRRASLDGGVSDRIGAPHDYDAQGVELALRLLGRAGEMADPSAIPPAIDAVLPGAALTIGAWREVGDRRLGGPPIEVPGRRRVVLESPDLGELRGVLRAASGDGGAGLDIVLPAGVYGSPADADPLVIERSGVRLLADGDDVVFAVGVRVVGATDVVLEGLRLRAVVGPTVMATRGAHVVLADVRVAGFTKVLYAHDSSLECIFGEFTLESDPGAHSAAVQLIGKARLDARASLFDGGSLHLSRATSEAWLDRCVVRSGDRPIVQSALTQGGTLMVRESLLRSRGTGILGVADGLLVATVLEAQSLPVGRRPVGLRASPRLFFSPCEPASLQALERLDDEPLPLRR